MAERMTPQEIQDIFDAYDDAILKGTANTKEWDKKVKDAKKALMDYERELNQSMKALGTSFTNLGKKLGDGETGASAFNDVLSAGGDTLTTFIGNATPATKAFTAIIKAGVAYVGAVTKQADAIYKSYQDISRAGTIGFGGMTEVYSSMQRLGYGIKELDKFGALMKENSKDLAIFGGTATRGSKALAGLGNDLQHTGVTRDLLLMGLSVDEINKGATGYIKQQISLGQGRKDIGDKLSTGAVEYIKEMEMMSRLTGQTRQEQQDKINSANEQQAWNAKMRQLEKQEKAGDKQAGRKRLALQRTMLMLEGDMQQQFIKGVGEDISGLGPLAVIGGEKLIKAIQDPAATEEEMLTAITEGYKNIAAAGGETLQKFNAFDDSLGKTIEYETLLAKLDKNKVSELIDKAKLETKAADKATSHIVDMEIAQRKARDNLQDFVNLGVNPVTKAVEILSKVVEWITDLLPGVGKSKRDRDIQKQVAATKTKRVGVYNKNNEMVYVTPEEAEKIKRGEAEPPDKSTVPASGAGGEQKVTSQSDLKKLGLNIKEGDVQAEGATIDPRIIDMAKKIQETVPGFDHFNGFNDKFHQEKASTSEHTKGRAVDFALKSKPSKEEGAQIVALLKSMGASLAIDEYNNASAQATGGHMHAQISAKDGFDGVLSGPSSGYTPSITMHGTEALKIEPMTPENIFGEEQQKDDEKTQMLNTQLANLDSLYRTIMKQNDLSTKILQRTS